MVPVPRGEEGLPAVLRPAGGGPGHVQPPEHRPGVRDALAGHVARGLQRAVRPALRLCAPDQLGQPRQVAQRQVQAQEAGDGDEPGAVEGVVQVQRHDQRRRALGIALGVPFVALPLGHQAPSGACQRQHHQQQDGEAHGAEEFVDSLDNAHFSSNSRGAVAAPLQGLRVVSCPAAPWPRRSWRRRCPGSASPARSCARPRSSPRSRSRRTTGPRGAACARRSAHPRSWCRR